MKYGKNIKRVLFASKSKKQSFWEIQNVCIKENAKQNYHVDFSSIRSCISMSYLASKVIKQFIFTKAKKNRTELSNDTNGFRSK